MVISCVAYSCTNQQKTGSNISLFSGNLCCICLCCVSVYVNECNSFEKNSEISIYYRYVCFCWGSVVSVHYVFPSSHIDWVQHKML